METKSKTKKDITKPWQCPKCKSNSVALDPDWDHKHFSKGYKDFEILIRCCNCQMLFLFKFKLVEIKIH